VENVDDVSSREDESVDSRNVERLR